jgi:hypothetical protein
MLFSNHFFPIPLTSPNRYSRIAKVLVYCNRSSSIHFFSVPLTSPLIATPELQKFSPLLAVLPLQLPHFYSLLFSLAKISALIPARPLQKKIVHFFSVPLTSLLVTTPELQKLLPLLVALPLRFLILLAALLFSKNLSSPLCTSIAKEAHLYSLLTPSPLIATPRIPKLSPPLAVLPLHFPSLILAPSSSRYL